VTTIGNRNAQTSDAARARRLRAAKVSKAEIELAIDMLRPFGVQRKSIRRIEKAEPKADNNER
jgi:hypothetical protein